ncbi:hypothetical protein P3T35_008141 [Kitasatospora sp. GP30]|uniref:hypothetical protein n=1 Tax=Kitasatospora sp. GP30 TaxID=3035084 RepID=UPI000C70A214|nr:hypothetical protein [Kitasatospora sp. GP30]MDH6146077.1 hypothetical protein [Kitasatospora sp. GP30]
MIPRHHQFGFRELQIRGFGQTGPKFREACIRCPVLRPDPAEKDRLAEIAVNLEARIAEAQQRGWHGEVAGLEATLAAAHDKLRAMGDLTDRTHTYLGMPAMGRRSD